MQTAIQMGQDPLDLVETVPELAGKGLPDQATGNQVGLKRKQVAHYSASSRHALRTQPARSRLMKRRLYS